MIQILETSAKDFKVVIIMLHEAKVNALEMNGRKVLSREIKTMFLKTGHFRTEYNI